MGMGLCWVSNIVRPTSLSRQIGFYTIAACVGTTADLYLFCCTLQKNLGKFIGSGEILMHQLHNFLSMQAKTLLSQASETPLSLEYWEKKLNIPPLTRKERKKVFCVMLVWCKITKFWDVNYKILARILATPVVLHAVNPEGGSANCVKCGAVAGISHILLQCPEIIKVHTQVCELMQVKILDTNWIFGVQSFYLLSLIWIMNFGVYKHHLCSFHGQRLSLWIEIVNETTRYAPLFPVLHDFNHIAHNNLLSLQDE